MTPRELLAAFETLADAPDGVKRLRELVLQLAVRGRLVPQGSESADAALESIRAQRIKAGTLKSAEAFEVLAQDDWPFEPPPSWRMARFGDVFIDIFTGPFGTALKAHEYVRGGTPIVNPQHLRNGRIVPTDDACVGPSTRQRLHNFSLRADDIVVARRGEMGRCAVVDDNAAGWLCGTGSLVLRPPPELSPRFVAIYLNSPWTVDRLGGDSVGSTMKNLNQRIMAGLPFGLPPVAEQHRIVARVDELMGLLDRLEAARGVGDEVRRAARDAALTALRDAEGATTVELAWARISGQMEALVKAPEDILPLRQALRQLAIRGRLVPQSRGDSMTGKAIAKAREQLASQPSVRGRTATKEQIRGDAALSVGEWGPRVIPEGWVETPLASVTRLESGHTPDRMISQYWDGDFCWIGIQDARRHRGGTILETEKRITQAGIDNSAARLLPAGTVCLSRTASVGYTVIMGTSMCTSQDFVNFVCTDALVPRYLQLVFEAEYKALKRFAKGAVHLTIYFPEVKAFHILLPPVAEQNQILSKVDALMALCNDLEAHLSSARGLQAQFAAAAVHHLDV